MEIIKKQKDICDICSETKMCISFEAEPHYYYITLCETCLKELLGCLK